MHVDFFSQRWTYIKTPVLIPSRIPNHWPDAKHLKEFSYHEKLKSSGGSQPLLGCCTPRGHSSPNTEDVIYKRTPTKAHEMA